MAGRLKAEVTGPRPPTPSSVADVAIRYTPMDELQAYIKGGLKFSRLQGKDADKPAAACVSRS